MTSAFNPGLMRTEMLASASSVAATPSRPERAPSPFLSNPSLEGGFKPSDEVLALDLFIPEGLQGINWQTSRRSSLVFKRPDLLEVKRSRSPEERFTALKKLATDKSEYINDSKADGRTVLHLTAEAGHLPFLRFLVKETPADVRALTTRGETPLHLALKNPECVRILLSNSISEANSVDYDGKTPLHLAALAGRSDSIYLLIILGKADPEKRTKENETALHIAARVGDLNSVRALTSAGKADAHARDSKGNTPLLLAALNGSGECVQFLVAEAKADVYAMNSDGVSFKGLSEEDTQFAEIFKNRPQK